MLLFWNWFSKRIRSKVELHGLQNWIININNTCSLWGRTLCDYTGVDEYKIENCYNLAGFFPPPQQWDSWATKYYFINCSIRTSFKKITFKVAFSKSLPCRSGCICSTAVNIEFIFKFPRFKQQKSACICSSNDSFIRDPCLAQKILWFHLLESKLL